MEASAASRPEWPETECEARRGKGPFAPAATMRYVAGPDGRHATIQETLHLRIARRLWDAALPSLCRPSEYGKELAAQVYLDDWSGQSAADMKHTLGVLKRLAWPHVNFLTIVQVWQAGGFDSLLPDTLQMPDYPPTESHTRSQFRSGNIPAGPDAESRGFGWTRFTARRRPPSCFTASSFGEVPRPARSRLKSWKVNAKENGNSGVPRHLDQARSIR